MQLVQGAVAIRIIPACAGNSIPSMTNVIEAWDHPRVCGEQFVSKVVIHLYEGSSPRVRGTESFS